MKIIKLYDDIVAEMSAPAYFDSTGYPLMKNYELEFETR